MNEAILPTQAKAAITAGLLATLSACSGQAGFAGAELPSESDGIRSESLDIVYTEGRDHMEVRVDLSDYVSAEDGALPDIDATWNAADGVRVSLREWSQVPDREGVFRASVPAAGLGAYELAVHAIDLQGEPLVGTELVRGLDLGTLPSESDLAPAPVIPQPKNSCACAGSTVTVSSSLAYFGGSCSDTITGTSASQTIYGEGGRDTIRGRGGVDYLYGGACTDYIEGEGGDDHIYGDAGIDYLEGNRGDDHLFGGTSGDTLDGNLGDDELYGEDGNDQLNGGSGTDLCCGGPGIDTFTSCEFIIC